MATTNGQLKPSFEDVPVTKAFAGFVADLTYESIDPKVLENLKWLLLDYLGVTAYGGSKIESSEPFLHSMLNLSGNAPGTCTVLTKGQRFLPQYAALLNGVYSHTLDFDDTFADGPLHPGSSIVSAALTQAEVSGADGKCILTGLAAGYEIICRLSSTLGYGAYERGFHNTGTAGIFGAVSTIIKIKGSDSRTIEAALGLAGSKAASSVQFLDNAAWNKRLHPGFAVHDALICISLAEAGVIGAAKPIEGMSGFLKGYSATPKIEGIIDGLGKEWIHIATAIKPYPGYRFTHAVIDMAGKWRKAKTCKVQNFHVSLPPSAFKAVGRPVPNKIHPKSIVDAQFSAYYQLALAWLDGNETGWAVYNRLYDKDVYEILDRITIEIGEDLGVLASRLEIRWEDGTIDMDLLTDPLGEPSNPLTWEHLLKKFRSLSVPAYREKKTERIIQLVAKVGDCRDSKDLMSLLA